MSLFPKFIPDTLPAATPATSATPCLPSSGNSESSNVEPFAWNATPDPSTAIRPFNDEDMQIIKDGGLVQVWSELLGEWLLWVNGDRERKALKAQGCRVPIYTLGELALVVSWPEYDIQATHVFKKQFNGVISEVGKPGMIHGVDVKKS